MRAIAESIFNVAFLLLILYLGISILRGADRRRQFVLFGLAAIVLWVGVAAHLFPRMIALNSTSSADYQTVVGIGELASSIALTAFYVLLYYAWRARYTTKQNRVLDICVWVLAFARVILCLLPQNAWTSADTPISFAIYRNIPLVLLGAFIAALYLFAVKTRSDRAYRFLGLALVLALVFYIPVVLFAHTVPALGMLMMPMACMYAVVAFMGYFEQMKQYPPRKAQVQDDE